MAKQEKPALPPEYGPLVDDGIDAIDAGWGQGTLSDGRDWEATLQVNTAGFTTLLLVIPALEDEVVEDLVKRIVTDGVIVPRVRHRLRYGSEWYAECDRPEPTWMVEFVLSDATEEWAAPGFEVYDDDDYVEY